MVGGPRGGARTVGRGAPERPKLVQLREREREREIRKKNINRTYESTYKVTMRLMVRVRQFDCCGGEAARWTQARSLVGLRAATLRTHTRGYVVYQPLDQGRLGPLPV